MLSHPYRFPLAIQTVLPEQYRQDAAFRQNLQCLQQSGFSGVELNMAYPTQVDFADMREFLREYDLAVTMFASGLTAKTGGLSLSSGDPEIRQRSVAACQAWIDRLAGSPTGIIIGFLKGGPAPKRELARQHFRESLQQLSPYAAERQVKLLLEATNRYESAVANTLAEAVALIRDLHNPWLRILPDTFHMNIEETDQFSALTEYAAYYDSIHLSDNNRFFPGLGAIRFQEMIDFLKANNYIGGLAIEGSLQHDFGADVKRSMAYLAPLLQ